MTHSVFIVSEASQYLEGTGGITCRLVIRTRDGSKDAHYLRSKINTEDLSSLIAVQSIHHSVLWMRSGQALCV